MTVVPLNMDTSTTYEVTFPLGLSPDQAARFFAVLSGLPGSVTATGRRVPPVFAVELVATAAGLQYYLSLPAGQADTMRRQLLGVLPDVGLKPVMVPARSWTDAVELHAAGLVPASSKLFAPTLLSTFHNLQPGEAVLVQVVVSPLAPTGEAMTVAVLPVVIRLAVAGSEHHEPQLVRRPGARRPRRQVADRPAELLGRVLTAFASIGVRRLRTLRSDVVKQVTDRPPARALWPQVLSPATLAVVTSLPIGSPMIPGLVLGRGKQLAPVPAISRTGRRIAVSTFGGDEQPLALSTEDRLRGLYVVGPLGSGKTTLLENLIADDMAEGFGMTVVDAKGGPTSLVNRVLELVPRDRLQDVVLFDVADVERPIGFNVLASTNPVRTTSDLVTVFDRLFDFSSNTPRALDVLRSTVLTLVEVGMTLCELAVILEPGPRGQRLRDQVVPQLTNPELISFWHWYAGQSGRDQADIAAPIVRRLRSLLLYPPLRLSLGQATSGFDMDAVLAENKILLVPLARGQLGDELAELVGSLVLTQWWAAVQRRGAGALPHFAYLDEFQDLLRHIPTTAGEMCSQCRGYNVGLTLAHQHVGQLGDRMRDEIGADVRSKVVFQTSLGTKWLAEQLGQGVTPADIESVGAFQALVRLHTGHQTVPAVSARTMPPRSDRPELGQAVRIASRTRYGRRPEQVEAELVTRHGTTAPARVTKPSPAMDQPLGLEDWGEPWDD
jgi:hypothetical protein